MSPRRGQAKAGPTDPETALLGQLPVWLQELGLVLKQKRHYKAGKLTRTRNWCQLFDDGLVPHLTAEDSRGRMKTWKLFARFSDRQPPASPWDRPRLAAGTGIMMGRDVWGVAVEDVQECVKSVSSGRLLERLADDLRVSFDYARRSYL